MSQISDFLNGVVGVVEATSYERRMLWVENQRREQPKTWEEQSLGLLPTIGYLDDRPICLSLFVAKVGGHKLLFMHVTSQVSDYRMVDEWLRAEMPRSAFRESGFVNKVDAMNFHNVFPTRTLLATLGTPEQEGR